MLEAIEAIKQTAIQLRGSLFTLSVLQILTADLDHVLKELKLAIHQAPKFFDHAPIVVDLQHLQDPNAIIDFADLQQRLREQGLIPVGIRGGNSTHHQQAKLSGLAILSISKSDQPQLATKQKPSKESKAATKVSPSAHNRIMTKPVRSGQQVYAKDGDLVVLGSVSHGSELLADGNIHVYGPLRGRALAGINGNTEARIFCQSMEAELVSIAGRYIVNEAIIDAPKDQAQQIFLSEGKLVIRTL